MPYVALLPTPRLQFTDIDGAPLVGGKLFTYVPNTFDLATTYQDPAGTVPNTNPITLDDLGSCSLWGYGSFRFVLTDADSNLIFDQVSTSNALFLESTNLGSYPGAFSFGPIIFNYGNTLTISDGTAEDTFAQPFTTRTLGVQAILNGGDTSSGNPIVVTGFTLTTVSFKIFDAAAGAQIDYLAYGY